jgi:membrane associated rhomboid family serine protease
LIPLKDNVPNSRLPLVTILLIVVNVAVFAWQLSFSESDSSNSKLHLLGITERDENSVEYGAIPYRILHPGRDCAFAFTHHSEGQRSEVVCQGTADYAETQATSSPGSPFAPYPNPAWFVTLFTSMFMHGGILHIAFNMLFLWIFGNNIEDAMGRGRFLAFYLLAGLVAVYSQALLDPNSTLPTIGASGAIAGVLGAYALLLPRARVLTAVILIFFVTLIEIPAWVMLGVWFLLQFVPAVGQVAVPDVTGSGGVAYFAHVGGFVFGLAFVKLFVRDWKPSPAAVAAGW